jgi:hypothetical protein
MLPKYEITIDEDYSDGEDLGIEMIAFTSNPAILVKGMAFNSNAKPMAFTDEVKMRIAAPAMIPMNIYRKDDEMGEYEVVFTKSEVERIYSKFMQDLNNKDLFNLEHKASQKVPAFILEAWIVEDPKNDKAYTKFGIEVPSGSIFIVSQITDKDYYTQLVKNGQVGYSIEGFLGMKLPENFKNQYTKMEETKIMLPDGEHTIGDKIYTVKDGVIIEVKDIELEEVKEEEMATDEKEEVVMEEVKEEEVELEDVKEEEVVMEETPNDYYSKEEVDNKFTELYDVVAELKAAIENKEEVVEEVEMSEDEEEVKMKKFSSVMAFIKNKNN